MVQRDYQIYGSKIYLHISGARLSATNNQHVCAPDGNNYQAPTQS